MSEQEMQRAVLEVLATVAPEADSNAIDPDESFQDQLDIDSIDFLNFVMGLHQRTGIDVPERAVHGCRTQIVTEVREPGWLTSLSMMLLKLTSPGVPDVYQGCELWDLSLVDPDNRRPVDHDLRARLLDELGTGLTPEQLLARLDEGLPKLWTLHRALTLRSERPEAFGADADYLPLWASGPRAERLAAFARDGQVVTIAPLQVAHLGPSFATWRWEDTCLVLPEGRWTDRFTGQRFDAGRHAVADLLARFPVALLAREDRS